MKRVRESDQVGVKEQEYAPAPTPPVLYVSYARNPASGLRSEVPGKRESDDAGNRSQKCRLGSGGVYVELLDGGNKVDRTPFVDC